MGFPISTVALIVAFLVLYVQYVRGLPPGTLKEEVLELEYGGMMRDVGALTRDEIVAGVAQISQFVLLLLRPVIDDFFASPYGDALLGDASIAVLPAAVLFFVPSSVKPGSAVLTWDAVSEKFNF